MKKAILTLAVVLAGCASHGVQVDPQKLTQFKEGVTTEQEVIAALGQPTTVSMSSGYGRTLIYSGATAQARPATFIPIVGAFAGGADVRASTVVLRFDREGKLISMNSSQTQSGSGHGFAAGAPIDQVQDQPRRVE